LFQTYLDVITCNLWVFLNICYILEVKTLQQVFHLRNRQKSYVVRSGECGR
jgi:hypothetical protein